MKNIKKFIFSLLGILLFSACSGDSNNGSVNQTSLGSGNNEVSSCNYTFGCESATFESGSTLHVKDGILYTNNDSIVFSGPFLYMAKQDDWTLSDFMKRLEDTYWTSFTLKDTLLTEAQVEENLHYAGFKLTTADEIIFGMFSTQEEILFFVTKAYNECKQDPNCYLMYQARLDGTENPLNGEVEIDSTSIKNDVQNFTKLRTLDLEGYSNCKLTSTKCTKDRYVTD